MKDNRQGAIELAEEILANIEYGNLSLSAVMLKCARLARIIRDDEKRVMFGYEAGGYPSGPDGVPPGVFELGRQAGRTYVEKDSEGNKTEKMKVSSIEILEKTTESYLVALAAAADPAVSVSSSNPSQYVHAPQGNQKERQRIQNAIFENTKTISRSRELAYNYACAVLNELKFAASASSAFDGISQRMDLALIKSVPSAVNKTASIADNLASENSEDWANAVHTCRRLLQDVADQIFPAQEPRIKAGKTIKLGADNYINRLIAYIEDRSESRRYQELIGSTLSYMGERLDAIFQAAQKGSHAHISSREEAERYVIYTYLTLGDILSLTGPEKDLVQSEQELA